MLSRVAEDLYWAARYLERADNTARIVREHTNLIVDLPTTVPVTWEPLLALTGSEEAFDTEHKRRHEAAIVEFLVSDGDHPSSVFSCVAQAREDLRAARDVVPVELWQEVNDLYLFLAGSRADGVARPTRRRVLDRVVAAAQRTAGIVVTTMLRDNALWALQLGTTIERADMTTRMIDVSAAVVAAQGASGPHTDVQWASMLRSLGALQAFRRSVAGPALGGAVVGFCLNMASFPRSVRGSLEATAAALAGLPERAAPRAACAAALDAIPVDTDDALDPVTLRKQMDALQIAIATIHDEVTAQYFSVETTR